MKNNLWISILAHACILPGITLFFSCHEEPTSFQVDSTNIPPNANWKLIWQDEFDGAENALPSEKWFFFYGWNNNTNQWRDAYYTQDDAYLDGEGHLLIRARIENDSLKTSYLRTYDQSHPKSEWSTFGAENGKYFEADIKVSGLVSGGLWAAFWLFASENRYDGDPSTGTEIDIMEYIVAYGNEGSWIKNLPDGNSLNHFNVATHWGKQEGQNVSKLLNAGDFNIDINDGEFHRFGLRWLPGELTYYLDGVPVYTISEGVSSGNNQALILSMEYDAPPNDAWKANENVLDYLDSLPNYFMVNYVRVYNFEE